MTRSAAGPQASWAPGAKSEKNSADRRSARFNVTEDFKLVAFRLIRTIPEDEQWLEELRRVVYQDLFVATWGGWDEERHQRHFAEFLRLGEIHAIEYEGIRVGMLQLFEQPDSLEVGEIQIEPKHQGRGIGTTVLRDVIARAHAQKKKVTLSTGLKNDRAIALYRRLGFEQVAQTKTHECMECKPDA